MRRLLLALLAPTLFAAPVPGTRVLLEPPPGFTAAEQFPGFLQKASSASIMVNELPAPFAEATRGFTAAGLATRHMKLVAKEEVTVSGRPGMLLRVTQDAQGTAFGKWMLAFEDADKTFLLVATYPLSSDKALAVALRRSLLGATLSAHQPALTDGLTFSVEERPPLQITQRLGNNIILALPDRGAHGPFLVVSASITEDLRIPRHSAHARERIRQTEHLTDIDVLAEKPIEVGGLHGVALIGSGRDKQTGAEQFVLQTTLYNDNGYYLAQGFAPIAERATYEPLFEAIISSFREKR